MRCDVCAVKKNFFLSVLSVLLYYMAAFYMCFLFHTLATNNMIRFLLHLVNVPNEKHFGNIAHLCVCCVRFFFSASLLHLLFATHEYIIPFAFGPLTFLLFYYHTIHAFALNPYLCIIFSKYTSHAYTSTSTSYTKSTSPYIYYK